MIATEDPPHTTTPRTASGSRRRTPVVRRADLTRPEKVSAAPRIRIGASGVSRTADGSGGVDQQVAVLETPSGAWLIGADPWTRLCVAVHRPAGPDAQALFTVPAYTVTAASSWELEPQVGMALGDDIHEALRLAAVVVPLGAAVAGVLVAARGTDWPELDEGRVPRGSDLVRIPGPGGPVTYAESLARSRLLLRWEQTGLEDSSDVYRLDVLAFGQDVHEGRRDLTYRLSLNNRVLVAGNDIEVPADLVVRSSDTIRGLITMLTSLHADAPPAVAQQVLLQRRDELLSLVAENPGPFRGDERVEVRLPDGRTLAGTVAAAIRGADRDVRSYQWNPDRASLPGSLFGPRGVLRGGIVSPAAAVRASLLPDPDVDVDLPVPVPVPAPAPARALPDVPSQAPSIQPGLDAGPMGVGG
ncbi:hypothetical protein [Frankia gtarii]|uniref:hypothetical protein n=1 Tax=Frankia gtarii TaxID=2950102 RepID=UPI0021C01BA3|nr:hypothetical protein [Frankia gtarii]